MHKILLIVPHSIVNDKTRSGVGTYLGGMQNNFDVTVIDEGPNTEISKKPYFNLGDSSLIDYLKVANVQKQILEHLETEIWAFVISSTYEGAVACAGLGLGKLMPVYYRIHNSHVLLKDGAGLGSEKAHRVIAESKHTGIRMMADCPASSRRITELNDVPCIPTYNFLEFSTGSASRKATLLINCRFDEVKRPKLAAKIAARTGMHVSVMTGSERQVASWTKVLEQANVKDFEVVCGLEGEAKFKYISQASASLTCATVESFGLNVIESLPYCPTFIVQTSRYDWSKNFEAFSAGTDLNVFEIDRANDADIERVAQCILKSVNKKRMTKKKRSNLLEQWDRIVERSWEHVFTTGVECTKPLSAQLFRDLAGGKPVDWKEQPTLMRTVGQIHKAHAYFGLTSKGSILRKRK